MRKDQHSAAQIQHLAALAGAAVGQINPMPTPLDPIADVNLRGPAARLLPRLLDASG